MELDVERILKPFNGIDTLLTRKRAEVSRIEMEPEKFNEAYIHEFREMTKKEILEDRKERADKAKEVIAEIENELTEREFVDPYEKIGSTNDKILKELQQNKMSYLLQGELELADTTKQFEKLLEEYGEDEHFYNMIILSIKKLAKDKTEFKALLDGMDQIDPTTKSNLEKMKHTVTLFGNLDKHPVGLDNGNLNVGYEPLI